MVDIARLFLLATCVVDNVLSFAWRTVSPMQELPVVPPSRLLSHVSFLKEGPEDSFFNRQ